MSRRALRWYFAILVLFFITDLANGHLLGLMLLALSMLLNVDELDEILVSRQFARTLFVVGVVGVVGAVVMKAFYS